jgi:menaquinol-cytochrome c reductase iron-sulfur subunit
MLGGNKLSQEDTKQTNATSEPKGLTRRQFLTYALGGTGAFMAVSLLTPLVAYAVDPIRREGGAGGLSPTTWKPTDFNAQTPTHVQFVERIDDAWNTHSVPNDVYVITYQNKLMIMSHVCTHLGCHVEGSFVNGNQQQIPNKSAPPSWDPPATYKEGAGQYWFHCPCHNSVYNNYGVPSAASPAPSPLDLYEYQVVNGYVHVGKNDTRSNSTWDVNTNPTIS